MPPGSPNTLSAFILNCRDNLNFETFEFSEDLLCEKFFLKDTLLFVADRFLLKNV